MTTNLSDAPAATPDGQAQVRRFGRVPRWVHWTTALVMGMCLASAAVLYFGPLSVLVGRRQVVETVHLWSGFALPVPIAVGWLSRAFRADLRALNRFAPHDWAWLRERAVRFRSRFGRRPAASEPGSGEAAGKFNAGQKLYASFVAGAILVMLGTGLLMEYGPGFDLRLAWRTGATFVHDWLAFAVAVTIAGHLWMASRDPVARTGMLTGTVPLWWARRHHSAWLADLVVPADPAAPADPADPADPAVRTGPAEAAGPAGSARSTTTPSDRAS